MHMDNIITETEHQSWKQAFQMLNVHNGQDRMNMDEAEMLLHTLLHTSPYGVVLINVNGVAVMLNPIVEELFGYPRDAIVGKVIWDLPSGEEEQQLLRQHFQQILNDRPEPVPYFGSLDAADHRKVYVRVDWNYIFDKARVVQGLVCIIRDISKELENHVDGGPTMLEQVQYSRLASVEEVVARISHELNQPLSAIMNFSSGTLKRLETEYPSSDIMQSMRMILRQAQRAGDVIDRLKNFLKKGELRKESLNINQVVKDVIECMRPELHASKVCINFQLENLMPAIYADKVQIEQVLLNLIQNALESMRDMDPQNRYITIRTFKSNVQEIGISIIDCGHGIEQDKLDKIFEAFFTTKKTGMGVGLAISQSIVHAHGGEIQVTSIARKPDASAENNSGTTFTVVLPVRTSKNATSAV